jgi:PAS domain S-box-containing protein
MIQKEHKPPGQLASVFFGSPKAAFVSSLFIIAVAALLYIASLQLKEAAHIDLPTGQMEKIPSKASTALSRDSQEILVLNSYHPGHAWSDNEVAGIIATLQEAAPDIRYHVEYLDCKNHPKFEHFEKLKDLFKLKYGSRDIPVVIVADNPALDFALKYRSQLFPRSAIVFCGVNNFKKEMLSGETNITGLAEALNAVDTVSLALRLHPKTKTVVVVHDYTSTGLATRKEAEEQMKGKFTGVSFRYLEDMTKNELTLLLKGLHEESLVLSLAYSVFKDGEVIGHDDLARLLSSNAPVPVYAVHQERLGYGIVGGSLLSGKLHGTEVGKVALNILSGTQAADIPVVMQPRTRIMFDYNQLVRFGIPQKALPEGGIVVNRPIPFISSHIDLVVSMLLTMIILASGIVILGLNISRRELVEAALRKAKEELEVRVSERTADLECSNRQLLVELSEREKAELKLNASEQAFRSLVENAPDVIVRYDREGRRLYVNPEFERVNHLSAQEVLGKNPVEFSTELAPMAEVFTEKLMAAMASGTVTKIDLSWSKEGRLLFWFVRIVPEFDKDGSVVSALTIWNDITERKQSEEQIRKLNEELEERVQERTSELENKNAELERANRLFVGRELRMIELKERIKELESIVNGDLDIR